MFDSLSSGSSTSVCYDWSGQKVGLLYFRSVYSNNLIKVLPKYWSFKILRPWVLLVTVFTNIITIYSLPCFFTVLLCLNLGKSVVTLCMQNILWPNSSVGPKVKILSRYLVYFLQLLLIGLSVLHPIALSWKGNQNRMNICSPIITSSESESRLQVFSVTSQMKYILEKWCHTIVVRLNSWGGRAIILQQQKKRTEQNDRERRRKFATLPWTQTEKTKMLICICLKSASLFSQTLCIWSGIILSLWRAISPTHTHTL